MSLPSCFIHPACTGSESPTEGLGEEGPRVAAHIRAPKGSDPLWGQRLAPLGGLCTPFPQHVAVGVSHLQALVWLWVSLRLSWATALKIECRIRSLPRFFHRRALLTLPWPWGLPGRGGVWRAEGVGSVQAPTIPSWCCCWTLSPACGVGKGRAGLCLPPCLPMCRLGANKWK